MNEAGRESSEDLHEATARRWYAVQCLAHREPAAQAHLENQSYSVFLPKRIKTRRHARKLETVLVPFFPNYLFIDLDLSRERWRSINGTYGVARLVMRGDVPAPAPIGVVEALRSACDERGVLTQSCDLLEGQRVKILAGPFTDLVGELERLDDSQRVRVLLDIMGGRFPVLVPRDHLVPEKADM
jgi:transcription elongation factor/antiterminator RfaH